MMGWMMLGGMDNGMDDIGMDGRWDGSHWDGWMIGWMDDGMDDVGMDGWGYGGGWMGGWVEGWMDGDSGTGGNRTWGQRDMGTAVPAACRGNGGTVVEDLSPGRPSSPALHSWGGWDPNPPTPHCSDSAQQRTSG